MRRALLAVALLGVAVVATPSKASTYYDYWGYWHKPPGASAWQYSKVGASSYYLQAGTQVEGWRYAVGTASPSDPQPRPANVTYDDYCAGKNADSTYRVLLIVDYGTQSGAPKGPVYSCFGFNDQPSGMTVLTYKSQHTERDSGGLICGIDGYPKTGCGEAVSSPSPKPAHTTAASTTTATTPVPSAPPSHRIFTTPGPSTTGAAPRRTAVVTPNATTSTTASASPDATDSTTVVATQFVPPRHRGGIPYGFVAACLFVVALVGTALWQRRRAR